MNDRIFEINDILSQFVRMDKNYGYLSENQIYNFINYDKLEKNAGNDLTKVWNSIIKELGNKKNNTNCNFGQEGFLTIRSYKYCDYKKCIKLYVNLPIEKIEKDSIKIFKFLDKKKINHVSKIANNIKNDGIVIRVETPEEAREIINFINKKFSKDLRKTNPFTFREGLVGIGYDGNSSYNKFVSFVICEYLKSRKDNNNMSGVSYGDFNSYVVELYNYYFKDNKNLDELKKTYVFADDLKRIESTDYHFNENELLFNYENMFKVLIASLNENNKTNDIIGYISDLKDDKYENDRIKEYSSKPTIECVTILDDYIKFAIKEYGFKQAYDQLEAFIYDTSDQAIDKYMFITKKNNFRELFKEYDMANNIHKYIKNLNDYMRTFVKTDLTQITNTINAYIDFVGYDRALVDLKKFEKTRNYDFLDENFQDLFANLDIANNMRFITENNVEEYIYNYYQNKKINSYKM